MRVLIFGGTGYVGSAIVEVLLNMQAEVLILARGGSEHKINKPNGAKLYVVNGDMANFDYYRDQFVNFNADVVIYVIGLLRETATQKYVDYHYNWLVKAASLKPNKFVHISAIGVEAWKTAYQTTKYQAEQYLMQSGMQYAIVRPSVVVGKSDQYHFVTELKRLMRFILMPIPDGSTKFQPVDRFDLAAAVVACAIKPELLGNIYDAGGSKQYTLLELAQLVAQHFHRLIFPIPMPIIIAKLFAPLGNLLGLGVSTDQLTMLSQDNVAKSDELWKLVGLVPKSFEQSLKEY